YRPRPGEWVHCVGRVAVVARDSDSALYTVGADSRPGLTVNAHRFPAPFGGQGVLGFVDNGGLASAAGAASAAGQAAGGGTAAGDGAAQVPGVASPGGSGQAGAERAAASSMAAIPGVLADT